MLLNVIQLCSYCQGNVVGWLETVHAFSPFSSRKASPSKKQSGQVAAPLAIQVAGNGEALAYFEKTVPSFRGTGIMLHVAPGSTAAPLELVRRLGQMNSISRRPWHLKTMSLNAFSVEYNRKNF